MKRILTSLGIMAALIAPVTAFAADPVTVSVEPGVAIPLTGPQVDRFTPGFALTLKPLVGLTPFLDVGVAGSLIALPSKLDNVNVGTGWGIGPALRVKRPHDESNTGRGLSAVSPWVDGTVQYVRTGPLDRVGLSLAVGAAVPTSDSRWLWVGPFVRYTDIVQGQRVGFDPTDAHVLILGVSFEFGGGLAKKAAPAPSPEPQPLPPVVEEPKVTPPPPVVPDQVTEQKFQITAPFNVDSAVILPGVASQLNDLISQLNKDTDWSLRIEGHASSEGPPEPYNMRLSERRAQAVLEYLKEAGLPGDKMTTEGFSSTQPIASNKTEAGRKLNRRAELVITVVIVKKGSSK